MTVAVQGIGSRRLAHFSPPGLAPAQAPRYPGPEQETPAPAFKQGVRSGQATHPTRKEHPMGIEVTGILGLVWLLIVI
ncbi:hypothetical protein [Thioalkalivibrio sp. ALE12]|uniref:hypothetical protein n=1 Tax=Thioalkalivibrio sp. ALE12 TaxID=1158170 RepID=UPI0012DEF70B|nr:hypothetical protein [Thioalkalivibrio sp. ALE12]